MLRTSIGSATALVAFAGAAFAQPPGITPEMIATALPVEGAPLAVAGPYQTMSEPTFGKPGLVVFRPSNLDAFPARDTLPVVVWGNGGCAIDSTRYGGFLSTIASHGFVVLGTAPQEGAARRQATADDLRGAVDWAFAEAGRAGSPLNGKINTDQVAVMGQSCGGFLSVALGADSARRHDRRVQLGRAAAESERAGQPERPAVSDHRFAEGSARPRAADQRPRARLHDGRLEGDV